MLPGQKLEVVVPRGFDRAKLPEILKERRDWIIKSAQKMRLPDGAAEPGPFPPDSIRLDAVNLVVDVRCTPKNSGRIQLIQTGAGLLELIGETSKVEPCRMLLKDWLRFQGRVHLIPWIEKLSTDTGLRYERVQVRGSKSRWGSCSSRGSISLSWRLLFLPPEQVRHVLIHELCHTREMNHSPRFWSLVTSFEPSCKTVVAAMHEAWKRVPAWAN